MKNVFEVFIRFMGISILWLVLGMSFFLLFINIYHYQEVNSVYEKQTSDYKMDNELRSKIQEIQKNIELIDLQKNSNMQNINSLESIKTKLNVCMTNIDNEKFEKILNKRKINIKDVYEMQQFYQSNISNECLVKQLYEITVTDEFKFDNAKNVKKFIKTEIEHLIKSTDYLQKVIKSNSNYSFSSLYSKNTIYNQLNDSYYEMMNQYNSSIEFIYGISELFREVSK